MAGEQQMQPGAKLSEFAKAERDKLFPKNLYGPKSDQYGPQHQNALSDGDEKGKGNASYLGVYSDETGSLTDKNERKSLISSNLYNKKKEYYNVTDEGDNSVGI